MEQLTLVKSENFGNVQCDFYDNNKELWMTRRQLGEALEYEDPNQAIKNIHLRHKDRLDKFSGMVQLETPSGIQSTTIYSAKGIYEICRWSQQPKADTFFDWVYDRLEELRTGKANFHRTYNNTLDALMDIYHLDRTKLTSGALTVLIKAIAATAKQPKVIFDTPIGIKLPKKPKGVSKELADEVYNHLIDWLEKNESHFEMNGSPLQGEKTKFGMIIEDRVFIYPEVFRSVLLKGGYVEMTALRSLAQEDLVDTEMWGGRRRFKIRKYERESRKQIRFVSLKLLL